MFVRACALLACAVSVCSFVGAAAGERVSCPRSAESLTHTPQRLSLAKRPTFELPACSHEFLSSPTLQQRLSQTKPPQAVGMEKMWRIFVVHYKGAPERKVILDAAFAKAGLTDSVVYLEFFDRKDLTEKVHTCLFGTIPGFEYEGLSHGVKGAYANVWSQWAAYYHMALHAPTGPRQWALVLEDDPFWTQDGKWLPQFGHVLGSRLAGALDKDPLAEMVHVAGTWDQGYMISMDGSRRLMSQFAAQKTLSIPRPPKPDGHIEVDMWGFLRSLNYNNDYLLRVAELDWKATGSACEGPLRAVHTPSSCQLWADSGRGTHSEEQEQEEMEMEAEMREREIMRNAHARRSARSKVDPTQIDDTTKALVRENARAVGHDKNVSHMSDEQVAIRQFSGTSLWYQSPDDMDCVKSWSTPEEQDFMVTLQCVACADVQHNSPEKHGPKTCDTYCMDVMALRMACHSMCNPTCPPACKQYGGHHDQGKLSSARLLSIAHAH